MNTRIFARILAAASVFVSSLSIASGWDYNFSHRCIATTGVPGDTNYYADRSGCPVAGAPNASPPSRWQIAVETENLPGVSCAGAVNRSLMINGSGSPVKLEWLPHYSDIGQNWSVHLLVDQSTYAIPASCKGANTWTWYAIQDNTGGGGGPLPNGDVVESSHIINYSHFEQSSNDGSRLIAGATFFYNNKAHFIEIDLTSQNYAYPSIPNSPGLLQHRTLQDGSEYVAISGPLFGVTITQGVDSNVYIPWYRILNTVINNHWFADWSVAPGNRGLIATGTVMLAVEVRNKAIASAWHTNFRIGP